MTAPTELAGYDVIIVGGGQAALSVAYFLRRSARSTLLLDAEPGPGGAWRHAWNSLQLFSPASWSSLAGWPMPGPPERYPGKDEVVDYLGRYEERYAFDVRRPVEVTGVERSGDGFRVWAGAKSWLCKAVVGATGTWRNPYKPPFPGHVEFNGVQLHSAQYVDAADVAGKTVMIVGAGNSGAQIVAEVSRVASTIWVTSTPPAFLPDDVDGRILFQMATERLRAQQEGRPLPQVAGGLGDIVMIPTVKEARSRGVLSSRRPFQRFTRDGVQWPDGTCSAVDVVIWCTGFRPATAFLEGLGLAPGVQVPVDGTRVLQVPGVWLVGYGDWTGVASATLVGVMRAARSTAQEISGFMDGPRTSQ